MEPIKLQLHRGDARRISTQMCVMGHKNPLKRSIEEELGRIFQPIDIPPDFPGKPPVNADFLEVSFEKFPWRAAASLRLVFRRGLDERPADRLTTFLAFAYKILGIQSFLILPLSWRHPQRVATTTLYSIWLLAYFSRETLGISGDKFPFQFTIASPDLAPYDAVLRDNYQTMWEDIKCFNEKTLSIFRQKLDRKRVTFDVKYTKDESPAAKSTSG